MTRYILFFCCFLITLSSVAAENAAPTPRPKKINDDGDYIYEATPAKEAIYYKVDDLPPIKGAFFFRVGTIGPYDVTGDTGVTYQQMYTTRKSIVLAMEYERYLGQLLGKWTVKLSSGLTNESGTGRFSSASYANLTPKEKFNFLILPNTALLNYKFKFSDGQWLTPYVEAGPGYFTFLEYRTDGHEFHFGGAGVLAAGGGLLISMSMFDKRASGIMYEDYGVNHIWIDLQFRRYQGLDKQKDFSSNMATAGFGFAF